jgi:hypothetical protein
VNVYNVKVMGVSVGLTFSAAEALLWKQKCSNPARAVIVTVPYSGPIQPVSTTKE